jgi:UDP-2,3-diacylglucosamine hydrolase
MKKTYFAGDFHLGIDVLHSSKDRERLIVSWLENIRQDAAAIYLIGDVFDHYFEYKKVVPKGYVRFFGKLAELRDDGIPIYFFTGNHDMWMFNYFSEEFGIPIYRKPIIRKIQGKTFFIGHGDGLGPKDYGYKFIKKIFNNRFCQFLYSLIHPNIGLGLMTFFSSKSREAGDDPEHFLGAEEEWLAQYAERKIQEIPEVDFFIFGHRHLPIDYTLKNGKTRYINTGEWMTQTSYVVFDGEKLEHKFYENNDCRVFP